MYSSSPCAEQRFQWAIYWEPTIFSKSSCAQFFCVAEDQLHWCFFCSIPSCHQWPCEGCLLLEWIESDIFLIESSIKSVQWVSKLYSSCITELEDWKEKLILKYIWDLRRRLLLQEEDSILRWLHQVLLAIHNEESQM